MITIYLQHDPDYTTTWCKDKINEDDIEYTKGNRYQIAREVYKEWLLVKGETNSDGYNSMYFDHWIIDKLDQQQAEPCQTCGGNGWVGGLQEDTMCPDCTEQGKFEQQTEEEE